MENAVAEFVGVTGADEATARRFLAAAPNHSIEHAVSAFFNESAESVELPPVVVSPSKGPPPVPSRPHASNAPAAATAVAGGEKKRGDAKSDDNFVLMDKPRSGNLDETPGMPEEPERDVALLLAKHHDSIAKLREQVAPLLTRAEHDDIFLLRYLLSFDLSAAAEAIRWAVAWRAEPHNGYWLARAEEREAAMMKSNNAAGDKKGGINISAYHKGLKDGGPLQIVRPGLVDFGPMLDMHDHDRMVMFHVMQKEVAFRMCDRRTRETGRLVKLVVVNDFTAMRMSMPPKKVMQSYSESSKLAERLYPQMLQTTVCLNVPTWFSMVMKVGKLFMSAKTLDKFKICPKSGRIEDCPFVRKYFVLSEVPSFLGGPCVCAQQGGCVPGLANDAKVVRTLTKPEIDKLRADSQKEAREEKEKIEAFVARLRDEAAGAHASNSV